MAYIPKIGLEIMKPDLDFSYWNSWDLNDICFLFWESKPGIRSIVLAVHARPLLPQQSLLLRLGELLLHVVLLQDGLFLPLPLLFSSREFHWFVC